MPETGRSSQTVTPTLPYRHVMNRMTSSLVVACIATFGLLVNASDGASGAESTDTTVVTIDPNMPDDFLSLYPDLDDGELADLPSTGFPLMTVFTIAMFMFTVSAIPLIAALWCARRRATD
jgi:hypothetical protein